MPLLLLPHKFSVPYGKYALLITPNLEPTVPCLSRPALAHCCIQLAISDHSPTPENLSESNVSCILYSTLRRRRKQLRDDEELSRYQATLSRYPPTPKRQDPGSTRGGNQKQRLGACRVATPYNLPGSQITAADAHMLLLLISFASASTFVLHTVSRNQKMHDAWVPPSSAVPTAVSLSLAAGHDYVVTTCAS